MFMAMPLNLAIVAATFNKEIVLPMVKAARAEAAAQGARVVAYHEAAGSYEMPLIVDVLLADKKVDLAVVLGYIERGKTQHGEVMGKVVHDKMLDLQLKYKKPIGLGIIGPGATLSQARARNIPYARAAVRAALLSYQTLASLKKN